MATKRNGSFSRSDESDEMTSDATNHPAENEETNRVVWAMLVWQSNRLSEGGESGTGWYLFSVSKKKAADTDADGQEDHS